VAFFLLKIPLVKRYLYYLKRTNVFRFPPSLRSVGLFSSDVALHRFFYLPAPTRYRNKKTRQEGSDKRKPDPDPIPSRPDSPSLLCLAVSLLSHGRLPTPPPSPVLPAVEVSSLSWWSSSTTAGAKSEALPAVRAEPRSGQVEAGPPLDGAPLPSRHGGSGI
jgi:hypothetical protein